MPNARASYAENSLDAYIHDLKDIPVLSRSEEKHLFLKISTGASQEERDNAREKFIWHNLRLVISIALKYKFINGTDLLDLIQEGNLGLLQAVKLYQVDKGYKFSTYATFWIKQHINRSIYNKVRTIRLSIHTEENLRKVAVGIDSLRNIKKEEPTVEELAAFTGFSVGNIERYATLPSAVRFGVQSHDEEEGVVYEPFHDETVDVEAEAIQSTTTSSVLQLLREVLTDSEVEILVLRFGIGGTAPLSLSQIGQKFGYTKERARQKQEEAFLKIKRSPKVNIFRDLLKG